MKVEYVKDEIYPAYSVKWDSDIEGVVDIPEDFYKKSLENETKFYHYQSIFEALS